MFKVCWEIIQLNELANYDIDSWKFDNRNLTPVNMGVLERTATNVVVSQTWGKLYIVCVLLSPIKIVADNAKIMCEITYGNQRWDIDTISMRSR